MMELRTARMAVIGLLAALLCITGPFGIPLPFTPVPLSFVNFLLFLFLFLFGGRITMGSYLIYLLLGFCGFPVFSKGQAGAAQLLGPTGGFLVGFIFAILSGSMILKRAENSRIKCIAGLFLGMAVSYVFGLLWFMIQMKVSAKTGFLLCVLPFLPGDVVKIVGAVFLGREIKERIT